MKQYYEYEIQYQEVDANRRLRLFTLENYLLNVAGRASDEGGYGIQYLFQQGLTWVITRLNLELTYMPTYGEVIRIETWIEQNSHMLSTRDYRIYLGEQLIGQAKSIWTVLDLTKREIVNVFDQAPFMDIVDGEVLNMTRAERLTPIQEPTLCDTRAIRYSDVDYNNHCNSCKYLEIMLDAYTPAQLADIAYNPIRLDINYVKEVRLHQPLTTLVNVQEEYIQYQQKDEFGNTCCSARLSTIKNTHC